MLLGTDVAAAIVILEHAGADVIGLNCSTGPDYMRVPIRAMAELARVPLSVIPNAGIPINVNGLAVYPLEPEPMAEQLRQFVEECGVAAVGGCCGTTPEHIHALRTGHRRAAPSARSRHRSCRASPARCGRRIFCRSRRRC